VSLEWQKKVWECRFVNRESHGIVIRDAQCALRTQLEHGLNATFCFYRTEILRKAGNCFMNRVQSTNVCDFFFGLAFGSQQLDTSLESLPVERYGFSQVCPLFGTVVQFHFGADTIIAAHTSSPSKG
jgi:hypothetical protein